MIVRPKGWLRKAAALLFAFATMPAGRVEAHPHVFIDSRIDFVLDRNGDLTSLAITWRYDPFETLYVLTSIAITPEADGTLSPEDRARLIRNEANWPEDFDGSSHLSLDGAAIPLSRPKAVDANMVDGHLVVRFRRDLNNAVPVKARRVEVAVYERTYYYAFSVAQAPTVLGPDDGCKVGLVPFDPKEQHKQLQATLAALGREETPEDANIGALFADRILLTCE